MIEENVLDLWIVFLESSQFINGDLSHPQIQDTIIIFELWLIPHFAHLHEGCYILFDLFDQQRLIKNRN